jgi:hypothetical protein
VWVSHVYVHGVAGVPSQIYRLGQDLEIEVYQPCSCLHVTPSRLAAHRLVASSLNNLHSSQIVPSARHWWIAFPIIRFSLSQSYKSSSVSIKIDTYRIGFGACDSSFSLLQFWEAIVLLLFFFQIVIFKVQLQHSVFG